MHTFTVKNTTASIFSCAELEAPIIYCNTFSGKEQKAFEIAQATSYLPFTLVAISNLDWNHDMVPWDNNPPALKHAALCNCGADGYLQFVTEEIIPMPKKEIGGVPC